MDNTKLVFHAVMDVDFDLLLSFDVVPLRCRGKHLEDFRREVIRDFVTDKAIGRGFDGSDGGHLEDVLPECDNVVFVHLHADVSFVFWV